jgi:hypothetical protein
MLLSCSGRERGSAISLPWGVIVRRDDGRGTEVKENDGGGWSSNVVVFWLGMSQNGDTVEWWEE